ncbi:aspartyl-tRNA synthetase [Paramyrothecium foliicola]|nr:aspartyl-tRNA synthetase [Paramyrothecium foliicola]
MHDVSAATAQGDRLHGFLHKPRHVSKHLSFADLTTPSGETIQVCSDGNIDKQAHEKFRALQRNLPVEIHIQPESVAEGRKDLNESSRPTVYLKDVRELNEISQNYIVTPEVVFPPEKRHLQIRFHPELRARLVFRSWLKSVLNQGLLEKGFTDIETPTLFRSTSEGAREFLVPVRKHAEDPHKAYALSQSPQQYKQILMASGVTRYMQWARCYRDEDSRADRQPEFSQLDLEWAFAGASKVRQDITDLVLKALAALRPAQSYQDIRGSRVPVINKASNTSATEGEPEAHKFTNLTFAECIAAYGTDKPDLRIPSRIYELKGLEAFQNFVGMITHLPNPLVEAFAFPLSDLTPKKARKLVNRIMDDMPRAIMENPEGKPQVLVYDSSAPLCGFSSLGFEYEDILKQIDPNQELKNGDIVVFQARQKPNGQYCAASTKIGELRGRLWNKLVEAELMEKPRLGDPGSLQFVWVTEFPMFKPVEEGEPGQGGASGFSAAHHPFTAPLSKADLEALFEDPLQAKSAAYDLVLNGVEIGGGSERNHIVSIQKFIMQDVLKMSDSSVAEFAHLFDALSAGCPPHAGFALGFDRFVALLTDTSTVRDVIAFPKASNGEDPFVKSPGTLRDEQLMPYGLERKILAAATAIEKDVPRLVRARADPAVSGAFVAAAAAPEEAPDSALLETSEATSSAFPLIALGGILVSVTLSHAGPFIAVRRVLFSVALANALVVRSDVLPVAALGLRGGGGLGLSSGGCSLTLGFALSLAVGCRDCGLSLGVGSSGGSGAGVGVAGTSIHVSVGLANGLVLGSDVLPRALGVFVCYLGRFLFSILGDRLTLFGVLVTLVGVLVGILLALLSILVADVLVLVGVVFSSTGILVGIFLTLLGVLVADVLILFAVVVTSAGILVRVALAHLLPVVGNVLPTALAVRVGSLLRFLFGSVGNVACLCLSGVRRIAGAILGLLGYLGCLSCGGRGNGLALVGLFGTVVLGLLGNL